MIRGTGRGGSRSARRRPRPSRRASPARRNTIPPRAGEGVDALPAEQPRDPAAERALRRLQGGAKGRGDERAPRLWSTPSSRRPSATLREKASESEVPKRCDRRSRVSSWRSRRSPSRSKSSAAVMLQLRGCRERPAGGGRGRRRAAAPARAAGRPTGPRKARAGSRTRTREGSTAGRRERPPSPPPTGRRRAPSGVLRRRSGFSPSPPKVATRRSATARATGSTPSARGSAATASSVVARPPPRRPAASTARRSRADGRPAAKRSAKAGRSATPSASSDWLDDVNAPAALTAGKLSAPDRGVESCGEVDVIHHPAALEIRFASRDQQIAHREVSLRTVQVDAHLVHLERHRLTQGAQCDDASATQQRRLHAAARRPRLDIRGQQRLACARVLSPGPLPA